MLEIVLTWRQSHDLAAADKQKHQYLKNNTTPVCAILCLWK